MASLPPRSCRHPLHCRVVDGHVDWPGFELMGTERGDGENRGIFHHLPCFTIGCALLVVNLFQRRNEMGSGETS